MSKKRKTRKEKIILQLKRQLGQKSQTASVLEPKFEASQEAISLQPQTEPKKVVVKKNTDLSVNFGNLKLIKKDLVKTLVLSLIIISFEIVLYLKLR
ncbi:hypothetical protein FJZ41_01800 [Candidatus Shapirobacteria bacterium]|nr:hypothetical protein [Candidatus Shapirobacteria bacterium]